MSSFQYSPKPLGANVEYSRSKEKGSAFLLGKQKSVHLPWVNPFRVKDCEYSLGSTALRLVTEGLSQRPLEKEQDASSPSLWCSGG